MLVGTGNVTITLWGFHFTSLVFILKNSCWLKQTHNNNQRTENTVEYMKQMQITVYWNCKDGRLARKIYAALQRMQNMIDEADPPD
jgi:hypothetical protein